MIEIPSTMTRIDVRTQADVDAIEYRTFHTTTTNVIVACPAGPLNLSTVLWDDWYCPECDEYLSGSRVTNDEKCDTCGADVECEPLVVVDWLIVQGGDDPMHPDHVRLIRDQAVAAGVPFALEWGEWAPSCNFSDIDLAGCEIGYFDADGTFAYGVKPYEGHMVRIGRDRSGCNLDGVEWDQRPEGV